MQAAPEPLSLATSPMWLLRRSLRHQARPVPSPRGWLPERLRATGLPGLLVWTTSGSRACTCTLHGSARAGWQLVSPGVGSSANSLNVLAVTGSSWRAAGAAASFQTKCPSSALRNRVPGKACAWFPVQGGLVLKPGAQRALGTVCQGCCPLGQDLALDRAVSEASPQGQPPVPLLARRIPSLQTAHTGRWLVVPCVTKAVQVHSQAVYEVHPVASHGSPVPVLGSEFLSNMVLEGKRRG